MSYSSTSSYSNYNYYDIDTILAEEELIPCTTVFDFSHLAGLDPDGCHSHSSQNDNNNYLPENTRLKLPLWCIEKWSMLGFIRLQQLPRQYNRKSREKYYADPGNIDLRKRNERFFMSGKLLVDLIERSSIKLAKAIANMPRLSRRSNRENITKIRQHTQSLKYISTEARQLKQTLLKLYAGERLRKNFDWSLSGGNNNSNDIMDDVSRYLEKLTVMEQRLYYTGSMAVANLDDWKVIGNRRLLMGPPPTTTTTMMQSTTTTTTTPISSKQTDNNVDASNNNKRRHVTPNTTSSTTGYDEGHYGQQQRRRLQ